MKIDKNEILTIKDLAINPDMIVEQYDYRGFTFQRMQRDRMWYVCYANQLVNWGQYQNDLKEWVDIQYQNKQKL